jgi:endonuclease/exonuclease/phosphatase family metal-dependent hydrolase
MSDSRTADSFRILSWNIERGLQFAKILEFLRSVEADLLLLQEVDLNARRTRCRDVAADLAHALKLNYAFGMEFQELSEGTAAKPAYHGMATLSRWPIARARVIRFRRQSNFWEPHWYVPKLAAFQRRLGGRIALVADLTIHTRRVVSYNLHLESRGNHALRLEQLNEVLVDCRRHVDQPTIVVAGDFNFNAGSGDAAAMLRAAGLRDAVGSPGTSTTPPRGVLTHGHAIDWIFVSESLDFRGRVHQDVDASDHYPVSATLSINKAGQTR